MKKLLVAALALATMTGTAYAQNRQICTKTSPYVNMRACPSTDCAKVSVAVPGEIVLVLGTAGEWALISDSVGDAGWVIRTTLCRPY